VYMCAYIREYLHVPNDLFELIFWVHACMHISNYCLCLSHLCRETRRTVSILFFVGYKLVAQGEGGWGVHHPNHTVYYNTWMRPCLV
jgi:hypothetical protein